MGATTLTTAELDTLVVRIFELFYDTTYNEDEDGAGCLDPIYETVEPLLENGVAPDARAIADALRIIWA